MAQLIRRRQARVTLAEAEDDRRFALERQLIDVGFDVVCLEDGDELFDYFEVCGTGVADVIISELDMPGRSGLAGLELARSRGVTAPMFVLASGHDREVRARVAHLENALLIRAPIDPERFARVLQQLFGLLA